MAMLRGNRKCPECGTEFKWDSMIRAKFSSAFHDVETIDKSYIHAKCNPELLYQHSYIITLECPHCGMFDEFSYSPEK